MAKKSRIYLAPEMIGKSEIILKDSEFQHIVNVLRFRLGEQFQVLDGYGHKYLVELTKLGKKEGLATILSAETREVPSMPQVHLVIASSKWPTMEWIVEKSTELGVASLQIVTSEHSQFRDLSDFSPSKIERLKRIVESALAQSGRFFIPEWRKQVTFFEFLKQTNHSGEALSLMAYEGLKDQSLGTYLKKKDLSTCKHIYLIVGSEGGWSEQETNQAKNLGVHLVGLGENVLRAETACLAMLAVLKSHLGQI